MEEAAASLRIRPRVAARITFHVHVHTFRSMVRLTARKRTWGPMRGAGLRLGMHFICPFVHSVDRPAAQREGQVPVHVSSRRGSGQALWRQNAE